MDHSSQGRTSRNVAQEMLSKQHRSQRDLATLSGVRNHPPWWLLWVLRRGAGFRAEKSLG